MINEQKEPNFLELTNIDDVNRVDLTIYTFVQFSDTRNCYIFKRRAKK